MADSGSNPADLTPAEQFVLAATSDAAGSGDAGYRAAKSLLDEHPEISSEDFHVALVMGDRARVAAELERDPEVVHRKAGPRNREPLLYVTFSSLKRDGEERSEGLLAVARLLLEAGADPDAEYIVQPWNCPLRSLYGACGVTNFPAMAELLLDHGAAIDDNESLYHSMEHEDTRILDLLIRRGVNPNGTNALNRSLDMPGLERTRKVLEHGADPNEVFQEHGTSLHGAVAKGRDAAMLELLIEHGAELDAKRPDGNTPYEVALLTGNTDAADLLESHGASTVISTLVAFQRACARGDREEATRLAAEHPSLFTDMSDMEARTLHRLAEQGRAGMIDIMLVAGFPTAGRGADGETALHQAAWFGRAEAVRVLIGSGAEIDPIETTFGCTPLGWAAHGSANSPNREGDYVGVVDALVKAGADLEVKNKWGDTLLAMAGADSAVAKALTAYGAA